MAARSVTELREALRQAPDHGDIRYQLALALLAERQRGIVDRAQTYLEVGHALIADGDMAGAASWLREALRLQPDLVAARTSLARALAGMGDLDAAIEEFRAILRTDPDVAPARLSLATALMTKHDWTAARVELEDVLRRQPDLLQAHYSLGVVRYTQGDVGGAIDAYRQVLAIDPQHHDARYNLAITLKLARREAEATAEFVAAAQAGVAMAQYFLGTAYAGGLGVERNLPLAVTWWFRAAEQGVPQAEEALALLRQAALGKGRRAPAERPLAEQAFAVFRAELWNQFPEIARAGEESVGAALLGQGRSREALPVLIREASALSEPAQRLLEALYEHGVEGQLAAHDGRILSYLKTAAAEGQPRPRIGLARIHAHGLGVPKDVGRAIALLKATPHAEAQRLLQELSTASHEVR